MNYIDIAVANSLTEEPRAQELIALLMEKTRGGALGVYKEGMQEIMQPLVTGTKSPIVREGDFYYLRRNFERGGSVREHLQRLLQTTSKFKEMNSSFPLYPAQEEALKKALLSPLLILSGGPGTGKTYLANAIIEAVRAQKPDASILFTAPTGKASFRIKNPHITQGTLHQLLGLREHQKPDPKPLIYDLIIVDECSMIDAKLFSFFLSAIPSGTHLILMGDPNQLPPVEGAAIFSNLFSFPHVRLDQSMRSDRQGILSLAKYVREGNFDKAFTLLTDPAIKDVNLVSQTKTSPIPLTENVVFLTPFREQALLYNTYIEAHKPPHLKTPLIITKNDYKYNLMNGDIGWKEGNFGHFPQKILLSHLTEYELAWAISVHKSQGSEFDHVVLFLPPGSETFGKSLLYTAITRAKQSVTIASSLETLKALMIA